MSVACLNARHWLPTLLFNTSIFTNNNIANAEAEMAATVGATALLHKMRSEGRMSEDEFQVLNQGLQSHCNEDRIRIPGNVIIQSNLRSRFEAISRVFNTAELLEHTLNYLSPEMLLRFVPLVCKGFRQITKTSLILRRKTFLEPDYKQGYVSHLPFALHGNRLHRDDMRHKKTRDPGQLLSYTCNLGPLSLAELLELRSLDTVRDRLITQPPMQSARISVFHWTTDVYHSTFKDMIVTAKSGTITVGDVVETVSHIYEDLIKECGFRESTGDMWEIAIDKSVVND